jgi:glutathione S-transferase
MWVVIAVSNLPTLYTFRRCPYAMRARMALALAGIAYQAIEVSLRDKPPELLAISPKGTVPVMQLLDGTVIDQSLDIMRWALGHSAQNQHNDDETNHWITLCDVTFKPLLDRYKYWNRHPELSREAHRERAMTAFIRPLNARIALHPSGEGYVLGSRASLADLAIFPFVRQFAAVDSDWFEAQPLPALQAWLGKWLASDLFTAIMKK